MRNFDQQVGGGAILLRGVYAGLRKCTEVTVLELSRGGAKLHGHELPSEGDELMLSLDGMRAFGTVAWVRGCEFGLAFDEPLPVEQLHKLQHQGTDNPNSAA